MNNPQRQPWPRWFKSFGFDALSHRIKNVASPISPEDATTKHYVDSVTAGHRAPVSTMYLKSDTDQGGAPPTIAAAGVSYVVNNWGPGYNDGDIIESDGTAWSSSPIVVANSGGFVPVGARAIIVDTSALGSFLGHEASIAQADGAGGWTFTYPNDGDQAYCVAELSLFENQGFIFDVSPPVPKWILMASAIEHNVTSGKQGGAVDQYYHLSLPNHGTLTGGATSNASGVHTHRTFEVDSNGHDHDGTNSRQVEYSSVLNKNHAPTHTNGTDDIQDASAALKGLVNIVAQSFAGVKTFVDGLISNKRLDVIGSTLSGAVGEEFAAVMNLQDPTATAPLVSMKGNLPTAQDYVEAWCGEDGSGQFGKGFLLKHDKAGKKWMIGYSASGKMDGTETWLFELADGGDLTTVGDISVGVGKTVDGVDISAHAIDANAHHSRQHAIDSTLDHVGPTTAGFDHILSAADNDLQKCLDTIDDKAVRGLIRGIATPIDKVSISKQPLDITNYYEWRYQAGGVTPVQLSAADPVRPPVLSLSLRNMALAYGSVFIVTAVVTSLTHNGTNWEVVIRCNKVFQNPLPPNNILFSECSTNDVAVAITEVV